jgi:hypothetical protein
VRPAARLASGGVRCFCRRRRRNNLHVASSPSWASSVSSSNSRRACHTADCRPRSPPHAADVSRRHFYCCRIRASGKRRPGGPQAPPPAPPAPLGGSPPPRHPCRPGSPRRPPSLRPRSLPGRGRRPPRGWGDQRRRSHGVRRPRPHPPLPDAGLRSLLVPPHPLPPSPSPPSPPPLPCPRLCPRCPPTDPQRCPSQRPRPLRRPHWRSRSQVHARAACGSG